MQHLIRRSATQSKQFLLMTLLTLACSLALSACGSSVEALNLTATPTLPTPSPTATPAPAPSPTPTPAPNPARFEAARCPFRLVARYEIEGQDVNCGYLTVPEQHAKPNGPTLSLAVAILKSTGAHPSKTPLIYLEGGPGGAVENSLRDFAYPNFSLRSLLSDHTIIFFDQRGAGYSIPSLQCHELETGPAPQDAQTPAARPVSFQDNLLRCRDRLVKSGINLAAYNTRENAADVNDLRQALGYDQIDLYGVSYGTRLAQVLMRDFPQTVRSVVLDGSIPLSTNNLSTDLPVNAQRAMLELFRACAADNDCDQNYPKLKTAFTTGYSRLANRPARLQVKDATLGKSYTVSVDGDTYAHSLFSLLYSSAVIPLLPALLTHTAKGDYDLLNDLVANTLLPSSFAGNAMYYSVQCAEEVQFTTMTEATDAAQNVMNQLKSYFLGQELNLLNLCASWGVPKVADSEREAVISDIPTLVLAGQFDPVAPPSGGGSIVSTLAHGYYVELAGLGHTSMSSVAGTVCSASIVKSFLQNPTSSPDRTCTASMSAGFVSPDHLNAYLERWGFVTPTPTH